MDSAAQSFIILQTRYHAHPTSPPIPALCRVNDPLLQRILPITIPLQPLEGGVGPCPQFLTHPAT